MRKMLLCVFSLSLVALLAGCSTSHSNVPIPPNPSGGNNVGFSNTSMNGTYVFNVHGLTNFGNQGFAVLGAFTANGDGTISGGTRDFVNDVGLVRLNEPILNTSTYFINSDGRGQIVLNESSARSIYRIVLESPSRGSLFQVGSDGRSVSTDAVGTIQLQTGSPATPAGDFILRVDGQDTNLNPYGAIGRLTFTGTSISGIIDENDSGTFSANLTANGTIVLSSTRGTATLATPNGPITGTHHFVVYFVSPTRVDLLSTDTSFLVFGHAEARTSFATSVAQFASEAPQQVFSLSGADTNGSRVEMGRVTLSAAGLLLNGVEDISTNNALFSAVNLSGSTFAVDLNGRWTANLVNSSGAPSPSLVGWQVSPERSIILTTNSTIVETGTMLGQTLGLTTPDVSGDFAERLSGFQTSNRSNLELTGQLRLDGGGALSGTFDSQSDNVGLSLDVPTSGTYSVDPALGRSTGTIQGLSVVIYTVDSNTLFFMPSHAGSILNGELDKQQP
jgi:hypothetical protein